MSNYQISNLHDSYQYENNNDLLYMVYLFLILIAHLAEKSVIG